MEYWNLEYWNTNTMEYCRQLVLFYIYLNNTMEYWNLEYWNIDTMEYWNLKNAINTN